MFNHKSLSVFIPVHNEEQIIDQGLEVVLSSVREITDDFEILLINDGSSDGSREKLLAWVARCPQMRLIEHPVNLGYGAALRSGFTQARKDLIFYTDMDLPADMCDLKKVIPLLDTYDLVIGYRIDRMDSPRRFIYSKIYGFLMKSLFNLKVKDINFSFKCVRKTAIDKVHLTARTGFIDGELLIEVLRHGCTIQEVPIVYRPRKCGKSDFDSIWVAVSTALEIVVYWLVDMQRKMRQK